MTYARQVELVDLSNTQSTTRRQNPGYTPRETLQTNRQPTTNPSPPTGAPHHHATTSSATATATATATTTTSQTHNQISGTYPSSTSTQNKILTTNGLTSEAREEVFRNCLWESTIDVDELRRIVWAHGVPSVSWARPLIWKLLTGYLPPDRSDWDSVLQTQRTRYWKFVHDVTVDPSECARDGDHPLNDDAESQWREYFQDIDMRNLIQRDVKRTHAGLPQFANCRKSLERILFVFAKCHSGLRYRQGMNELAAPFLLVFQDVRGCDDSDVEADAYFCFESIMEEMTTCYLQDDETEGIGRQLRELQALLRIKDADLECRFERLGIDTRFYGLRWLRLWLCHEFELERCLVLWDSLLTAEVRLPWLRYVCVAMLIRLRQTFLQLDFTACMKLLLNYPDCDVSELLRIADRLRTSNAVIVRTARR